MKSKVQILWDDVKDLEEKSLKENITERLDKSLRLYLNDIESSLDNLKSKKSKSIYKRLNK